MFSPDFYRCDICGNVIWIISNSSAPVICCGKAMTKLTGSEFDGAAEKHIPVLTKLNDTLHVQVGSVLHPSTAVHHIEWIALLTDDGMFFKEVQAGETPSVGFDLSLGTPRSVFTYCNIHGLWKADIDFQQLQEVTKNA